MRLAQLSAILYRYPNLFTKIEQHTEIAQFAEIFSTPANSYWETHYQFGKESKKHATTIGENTFQLLIINTIIPALYVYGIFSGKELSDRAIDLLAQWKRRIIVLSGFIARITSKSAMGWNRRRYGTL